MHPARVDAAHDATCNAEPKEVMRMQKKFGGGGYSLNLACVKDAQIAQHKLGVALAFTIFCSAHDEHVSAAGPRQLAKL